MGKAESAKKATVHTSVHIGEPKDIGGFGLAVDIKVEGVDDDVLKAGHEACFPVSLWKRSSDLFLCFGVRHRLALTVVLYNTGWL